MTENCSAEKLTSGNFDEQVPTSQHKRVSEGLIIVAGESYSMTASVANLVIRYGE